jgi:hypothetical protein
MKNRIPLELKLSLAWLIPITLLAIYYIWKTIDIVKWEPILDILAWGVLMPAAVGITFCAALVVAEYLYRWTWEKLE